MLTIKIHFFLLCLIKIIQSTVSAAAMLRDYFAVIFFSFSRLPFQGHFVCLAKNFFMFRYALCGGEWVFFRLLCGRVNWKDVVIDWNLFWFEKLMYFRRFLLIFATNFVEIFSNSCNLQQPQLNHFPQIHPVQLYSISIWNILLLRLHHHRK